MKSTMQTIAVLVSFTMALLTTGECTAQTKAQKMLKAKRGAQVDAYRKLSELIKGIQIDSGTYVRDFVTENDEIRTRFDDFIKGAKVLGRPRFTEESDGSLTAEVDVKVTLAQVMEGLAQMSYYRGPDKPPLDVTYMKEHVRKKEFVATGVANTGRNTPYPGSDYPQPEDFSQNAGPYGIRKASPVAGVPGWENVTAQGRLKAERAALTDARRNLAETVEGLRISGDTYVRDFVTESDEIRTQLDTFIKGVKTISPYRYYEGGIVEVDVQVTIQDVVRELTTVQQHLVQRGHTFQRDIFRTKTFDEIVDYSPKKVITATGTGTVHEMDFYDAPLQDDAYAPSYPEQHAPPQWARQIITATGVGVPARGEEGPAARVRAERAAEIDARRNLLEQVYGVHIDSQTTVRDYVTEDDRVNAEVTAFLSGCRRVGDPVYNEDGSVEVTVEADLEDLWYLISAE